jgi:uncharacterized protein (DUF2062 family)
MGSGHIDPFLMGYFGVGLPLVNPPAASFDFLARIESVNLLTVTELSAQLWHSARGHVIAFAVGMTVVSAGFAALAFAMTYAVMELKRKRRDQRRIRARESRPPT